MPLWTPEGQVTVIRTIVHTQSLPTMWALRAVRVEYVNSRQDCTESALSNASTFSVRPSDDISGDRARLRGLWASIVQFVGTSMQILTLQGQNGHFQTRNNNLSINKHNTGIISHGTYTMCSARGAALLARRLINSVLNMQRQRRTCLSAIEERKS